MIEGRVVHHSPGRMRVRVAAAKGDPELTEQLRGALAKVEGVLKVTANPALGTLVIQYDPELFGETLGRVTEHAAARELFELHPPAVEEDHPVVSHLDRAVDRFFGKANRIVEAATGEAVNLKEIFPLSVLLYSVLFVDKAIAASQWLSWVQFALSTYLELHEDEPIAEVGDSVKALRDEIQSLREELRAHFGAGK